MSEPRTMDLRPPPRPQAAPAVDRTAHWLLVANLAAILGLAVLVLVGGRPSAARGPSESAREVAAKLQAAGALDEAASLYSAYLESATIDSEARARIAYSLGSTYLDSGRYERALRWLYEAEALGPGALGDEVSAKIVHSLERLGRHQAAQAALASRALLTGDPAPGEETVARAAGDPVVARIGEHEIHRSAVEAALDGLPPEIARQMASADGRRELLRRFVGDELLWRKAVKLEYDDDPTVRAQAERLTKQLTVARFVEDEILGKIEVDPQDLSNFYAANRERYAAATGEGEAPPEFNEIRPLVEQDYRRSKVEAAYRELVESELAADEVELFPERMSDG